MERSLANDGGIAFIGATLLYVFLWLAQWPNHTIRIHKPVLVATPLFIAFIIYLITLKISNTKAMQVRFITVLISPVATYFSICVADEIEYYLKWGKLYGEPSISGYVFGSIIISETALGGIFYLILFIIFYLAERFIDEFRSRPGSA